MLPLPLALILLAVALPAPVQPLTLSATAFGEPVSIEVHDLPADAAESAMRAALAEIEAIDRLTGLAEETPPAAAADAATMEAGASGPAVEVTAGGPAAAADGNGRGLAALNAAAGAGARTADRRLVDLLARANEFCI